MIGFKITNVNFRQENMNMPVGTFTYGVTVRPVGTILRFKVGAESFTVTGLQAGQLARVNHTFTTTQDATTFYPSTTVGDEIFEPMLEVGTNASSPQAHYLDNEDLTAEAGLEITSEVTRLYASKGYVNSAVSVSAGEISSQVSDQISGLSTSITQTTDNISVKVNSIEEGLLDTGINITDKRIDLIADTIALKTNAAGEEKIHAIFGVDDNGNPILKANHIDIENLTVGKLKTKNEQQPKAIIDINGESNSMSVKDAQGEVKVLINPTEIGDIDDYFSDSVTRNFYGEIKLSESGLSAKNVFTPTGTIYAAKGDVFQISYDSLSIYAQVWNKKPDGTSWEPIRVDVAALLRINEESFTLGSVWASTSIGGTINSDTVDIKEGSIIYTAKSSGNLQFRLQGAYLPSKPVSIGEDYSVYGDTRKESGNLLKVEKVVNRSQIGLDGMMIANSKTSYTYMGQPVFETRRGNKGIRITSDGYFKLNSSGQWVEWNI